MKQITNIDITNALFNLTKEDLQRIVTEERINYKRAIEIAKVYNLDHEVKWCMNCGMTPQEALAEWDLL